MKKKAVFRRRSMHLLTPLVLAASSLAACAYETETGVAGSEIVGDDVGEETGESEAFNSAAYEKFLRETALEEPNREIFDLVGHLRPANSDIWIHEGIEPAKSLDELLEGRLVDTRSEKHDTAQGVLIAADGRVFLEKPEVYRRRVAELDRMPEAGVSVVPEPRGQEPEEKEYALFDTIHGSDGRTPVTSSTYPTRAVGVSILKLQSAITNSWSRGAGSAAMIGPRAALTAAHVISPNGRDWNVLGVAPAARGYSWCSGGGEPDSPTCKFPYGLRWVQWYYWPGSWDGDGITYDYGVLILQDLNWSPGSVSFGYQTATWLDYRTMDHAGYPAPSKSCANSFDGDGECGGYMYRQTESTNAVFTNTAYYDFDVQEGQSGAPIYDITSSTGRVVYIIHKGSEGSYSYGKRLRSGSYSTICSWVGNWPSSYFSNISC